MASIYSHRDKNIRNTWIIFTLFLVVVVGVGYFFSYLYNNPFILYVSIIFSLLMNFGSYWFSDKIVISLSGARPANRNDFFDLYTVTENLSITAGLPMPKLFVINDSAPNAFATGRNKEHAVVAVTTGLLDILDRPELEGVIAHELSHIGNRDILVSSVVVVLVGFISIISDMFMRSAFWGGHSDDRESRSGTVLMIIGVLLSILAPIIASLMHLAISRRREFLADASGALLTRYPEGLASALAKISDFAQPMKRASNATAHLFIANPFGGEANIGLHRLFLTHPPVKERIEALVGKRSI